MAPEHIPGHSGTDYKHRVAFEQLNGLHQAKAQKYCHTPSRTHRVNFVDSEKAFYPLVIIKGIVVILSMFMIFYLLVIIRDIGDITFSFVPDEQLEEKFYEFSGCYLIDRYETSMQRGIMFLDQCALDSAHRYFLNATGIVHYDRSARVGLAHVYFETCASSQKHCDLSKDYQHYLKEMNYSMDLSRDRSGIYFSY